ncbi:hypothetical protein AB0O20_34670 [Streptomyces kronopolitis]|uniref:hypothetical protein n=1 Tax=Streptomyces kronopolitis TaxID=1612435 RepID=UPI003421757D
MNTEDSNDSPNPAERGRRTPVVVASVAAAVLLAGGGAAYWASSASDDGGGSAKGDPPPLALDGYSGGSIAAGEPNPQGAKYRAVKELPGGPDAAPVYRPKGEISRESVERLAKALDVDGKVRSEGTAWKVGGPTRDGRGPVLQVNKTGSGSWTFSQYGTPGGTNCALPASPKGGKGDDGGGKAGDGAASSRPGCPSYRGGGDIATEDDSSGKGAVSPEKAKQAVRPVLKALGQEDAKLDTGGLSGAVRVVTTNPVLGGLPTYGWQSDLQVGSDGQVVGGSGQFASPVKGAEYPVLNAGKTLDRLNSGEGRKPAGCPSPPGKKDGKDGKAGGIAPCEPAPTKAQQPSEVTGAVFGLSVQYVDGGQALVPSWLYAVRQPGADSGPDATSTVAQPAVNPKYLAHRDGGNSSQSPGGHAPGKPSGKPGVMALESYGVSDGGKKLTVHFWGGVCSTYSASAEESGSTVRTKVVGKDKKPGQVCVKIAKEFTKTVTLDKPLDGRKVVDVSTDESVPKQ